MKERCSNPHNKSFPRYGGRGISVCRQWSEDYGAFMTWAMENGYEEHLTIDRINTNGNYEPDNCRWVTHSVQNRNYSRNRLITYNGKTQCVADWASETGIKAATIIWRIENGKTMDEVFSKNDGRSTRWKRTTSASCSQ